MNKRFLFITANRYETEALLKDEVFYVYKEVRSPISTDTTFYNIGKFGCYEVVHFELIDQGTVKSDAAILSIYEAIEAWQPDAVILVGIAFGKDDEKHNLNQYIGDVLVSKMVADYESGKIKSGNLQSDGFISESGRHLISVFQHYSKSWEYFIKNRKAEVIMGLLLSGDKVVDDETFKVSLFEKFPRAIGGEMEGRGFYSACRRKGIEEWIIVKAICDWGTNKQIDKEYNQIQAAESAVNYLKYIFSKPEAFDKLPINKKRDDVHGNIDNYEKNRINSDIQIGKSSIINIIDNKSENMFIASNVTINGGINIGRKFPQIPNYQKSRSWLLLTDGISDDIVVNKNTTIKEIRRGRYKRLVEVSRKTLAFSHTFNSNCRETSYTFKVTIRVNVNVNDPVKFYQNIKNICVSDFLNNQFLRDVKKVTRKYSFLNYSGIDEEMARVLTSATVIDDISGLSYRITNVMTEPNDEAIKILKSRDEMTIKHKMSEEAGEIARGNRTKTYEQAIWEEAARGKLTDVEAIRLIEEYNRKNVEEKRNMLVRLIDDGIISDADVLEQSKELLPYKNIHDGQTNRGYVNSNGTEVLFNEEE